MPSNSQALKALEQSAMEQKKQLENSIKEIHTQSLQELNKSLTSTYNSKLNNLENNIQKELSKSIQKTIQTKNWIIIALTALVSLSIAIPATWYLKPNKVETVVQTETKTQYKEVENPNLAQENKGLQVQNETYQNKIKQLQAENKNLKEWSIPDHNHGTTKDGKKWMLTSEVSKAENGKSWALVEK